MQIVIERFFLLYSFHLIDVVCLAAAQNVSEEAVRGDV